MGASIQKDWSDEEIIPISALSHFLYCPRQYALIHIDGIFIHNHLTVEGKIGHEYVDQPQILNDHGVRKETSLRVYSDRYGLSGIADVVEFPDSRAPFPIDYKHGGAASWKNHEVQLCAIALCLEEMMDAEIPTGAIYHLHSKKRHTVEFDLELRSRTLSLIEEIRALCRAQRLPEPLNNRKCHRCSLQSACLPGAMVERAANIFQPAELV